MTPITQTMVRVMPDGSVAIGPDLVVTDAAVADSLRSALLMMVHEIDMAEDEPPIESVPGGYLVAGQFYPEETYPMLAYMDTDWDVAPVTVQS